MDEDVGLDFYYVGVSIYSSRYIPMNEDVGLNFPYVRVSADDLR
jgi:phosphatidate phosphatase PAH1